MSAQDNNIELLKTINERRKWSPEEELRIKALLVAGANLNVKNEYGQTLLHWALNEGSLEAVKFLIENGADFNVEDMHGQTPLFFAQRYDYDEIAAYLLEKGARVARMTTNEQALWSAIRKKDYQQAEQLVISGGININAVDNYGATLLHTAVIRGTPQIVELLLKNGADVHAQEGMLTHTPLHFAAALRSNSPKENIELLIQFGADIEAKDSYGKTPLYCAVERVEDMSTGAKRAVCVGIAIQLLGHGANPDAATNKVDSAGRTLVAETPRGFVQIRWERLHREQFSRAEKAYKKEHMISEQRADKEQRISPKLKLCLAIKAKDYNAVKQLLEEKAVNDINAVESGGTLLQLAAALSTPEIVTLLLEKGADVHARNAGRKTALHFAASAAIVRVLLAHGADIEAKDMSDQTPLCCVVSRQDKDTHHNMAAAVLLLQHGANPYAPIRPGFVDPTLSSLFYNKTGSGQTARSRMERNWRKYGQTAFNTADKIAVPRMPAEKQEQLLQKAIRDKDYPRLEQLLRARKRRIDAVDGAGETLLHNAVRYSNPEIVDLLLINGANPSARNLLGQTPLHLAAASQEKGRENIHILVQNQADVEARDVNGQTPLCHAVSTENLYTARALLQHGANPDADAFIEDSSGDKLTARAYVQKHWHEYYARMFNKAEEEYKASNANTQTWAQLLCRSLSQVTNHSSSSSSSVPQTEHRQSPTPKR